MPVPIYPSGQRPQECPNGHSWALGSGLWLVGSTVCDCPNAAAHFWRHIWIRCRGDDEKCGLTWFDPPCKKLQPPASETMKP